MSIERIEQSKTIGDYEVTIARVKNIDPALLKNYDVVLSKMLKAIVAFVDAMLSIED
jgi:hypothetical protein